MLELEARLLGELNQDTRVAVGIKVNAAEPKFGYLFPGWTIDKKRPLGSEVQQPRAGQ